MCGTRACGTCARSRVCARHDLRTCKKEMKRQKFMSITLLSSYVAPMHSYVTNVFVYNLYITIFGRVYSFTRMYSCVIRMHSCGVLVTSYQIEPFYQPLEKARKNDCQLYYFRIGLSLGGSFNLSFPKKIWVAGQATQWSESLSFVFINYNSSTSWSLQWVIQPVW